MDGWIGGWIDGWVGRWTDQLVGEWMNKENTNLICDDILILSMGSRLGTLNLASLGLVMSITGH